MFQKVKVKLTRNNFRIGGEAVKVSYCLSTTPLDNLVEGFSSNNLYLLSANASLDQDGNLKRSMNLTGSLGILKGHTCSYTNILHPIKNIYLSKG